MGKPVLVLNDLACRIIDRDEKNNPARPPLSELEKSQLALKYIEMNINPFKYQGYKRYMSNKGDVEIPGYNSCTGKEIGKDN